MLANHVERSSVTGIYELGIRKFCKILRTRTKSYLLKRNQDMIQCNEKNAILLHIIASKNRADFYIIVDKTLFMLTIRRILITGR